MAALAATMMLGAPAHAADDAGPGSDEWVSANQLPELREALAPHGWQVSREDDGGLIVFRQADDEGADSPAEVSLASQQPAPVQAPAAGLIERLRAVGWQAETSEDGSLLLYPPDTTDTSGSEHDGMPALVSVPDQDGDGIADANDLCPDSNPVGPVDPAGCPPGKTLRLQQANFRSGSAQLSDAAKAELDRYAGVLKGLPQVEVSVLGYTDSLGGAQSNQHLSQRRADSVRAYLLAAGVTAGRVTAEGRGETEPVADNATPQGRRQNRRVELLIH